MIVVLDERHRYCATSAPMGLVLESKTEPGGWQIVECFNDRYTTVVRRPPSGIKHNFGQGAIFYRACIIDHQEGGRAYTPNQAAEHEEMKPVLVRLNQRIDEYVALRKRLRPALRPKY